jgi:hypothetical protein
MDSQSALAPDQRQHSDAPLECDGQLRIGNRDRHTLHGVITASLQLASAVTAGPSSLSPLVFGWVRAHSEAMPMLTAEKEDDDESTDVAPPLAEEVDQPEATDEAVAEAIAEVEE